MLLAKMLPTMLGISVAFLIFAGCSTQESLSSPDRVGTSVAESKAIAATLTASAPTATSTAVLPTAIPQSATPKSLPPTLTPSLSEAAGPRLIDVSTPISGIKIKDIFISADVAGLAEFVKTGRKPLSTNIRSGLKSLYVVMLFCPPPKSETKIAATVRGNSGPIDLKKSTGGIKTNDIEGCLTYALHMVPESENFPDGPYRTTLYIADNAVAMLNWEVGNR